MAGESQCIHGFFYECEACDTQTALSVKDARIAELEEEVENAGDFQRGVIAFLDDLEESIGATQEAMVLLRKECS